MKRRCSWCFLVIIELLLMCGWVPLRCWSVPMPELEDVSAEISAGYHLYNPKGYHGKVGEYEVLDTGSDITFLVQGSGPDSRVSLNGETRDKDDQNYGLMFDLPHILRSTIGYQRFRHVLNHDLLSNQDSARDFDPVKRNCLTVEEFTADNTFRIPWLPFLKFTGDVRIYSKHGTRQALTLTKCSQCHVSSRNRRVNTSINDITPGVEVDTGPATMKYTVLQRDVTEHGAAPQANYGDGSSSFLVRGAAPYSRIPDSSMNLHTLALQSRLPLNTSLFFMVQHGKRENKLTHRETGFNALAGRLSNDIGRFVSCDAFYTRLTTNNKTHGGIDHDRTRGGIDINLHPMKQTGIVCSYFWETVERDNTAPNETRKETYRIAYNQRLLRRLRLNVKYQRTRVDDPLITRDAAFSQLVLTSLPKQEEEAFVALEWTPRHNLNMHTKLRYTDADNNRCDGNEQRWEGVFSLWYAPLHYLTISGAYTMINVNVRGRVSLKAHHLRQPESMVIDRDVPYDSRSQTWHLLAAVQLSPKMSVSAAITLIDSVADFDKHLAGRNIGLFSDLSLMQTEASFGMEYRWSRRLSLAAQYMYREYNDHTKSRFDGQVTMLYGGIRWAY
ncbi:MAG: MtrB/PioB family outer membrane beta-barrel protein [Desulfobacterota bacterium]|nr:MtrB/PioB family outer membrane beta-barrel protein [Thermodesulfobacteriota bacterium]